MNKSYENLLEEVKYSTARSGGPGGQNVNKVESKVVLTFNVSGSSFLNETEKRTVKNKLKNRINNAGDLVIHCQETRSQLENKSRAQKNFLKIIQKALFKPKLRRKSKPKKSAIENRLKSKKRRSEVKANRRKVG